MSRFFLFPFFPVSCYKKPQPKFNCRFTRMYCVIYRGCGVVWRIDRSRSRTASRLKLFVDETLDCRCQTADVRCRRRRDVRGRRRGCQPPAWLLEYNNEWRRGGGGRCSFPHTYTSHAPFIKYNGHLFRRKENLSSSGFLTIFSLKETSHLCRGRISLRRHLSKRYDRFYLKNDWQIHLKRRFLSKITWNYLKYYIVSE